MPEGALAARIETFKSALQFVARNVSPDALDQTLGEVVDSLMPYVLPRTKDEAEPAPYGDFVAAIRDAAIAAGWNGETQLEDWVIARLEPRRR